MTKRRKHDLARCLFGVLAVSDTPRISDEDAANFYGEAEEIVSHGNAATRSDAKDMIDYRRAVLLLQLRAEVAELRAALVGLERASLRMAQVINQVNSKSGATSADVDSARQAVDAARAKARDALKGKP